jgi:hypothetical protein
MSRSIASPAFHSRNEIPVALLRDVGRLMSIVFNAERRKIGKSSTRQLTLCVLLKSLLHDSLKLHGNCSTLVPVGLVIKRIAPVVGRGVPGSGSGMARGDCTLPLD